MQSKQRKQTLENLDAKWCRALSVFATIPDLEYRIKKLEEFESRYSPIKLDFEKIVGSEAWKQHWDNCLKLHSLMQESQRHSDKIKELIIDAMQQTEPRQNEPM